MRSALTSRKSRTKCGRASSVVARSAGTTRSVVILPVADMLRCASRLGGALNITGISNLQRCGGRGMALDGRPPVLRRFCAILPLLPACTPHHCESFHCTTYYRLYSARHCALLAAWLPRGMQHLPAAFSRRLPHLISAIRSDDLCCWRGRQTPPTRRDNARGAVRGTCATSCLRTRLPAGGLFYLCGTSRVSAVWFSPASVAVVLS